MIRGRRSALIAGALAGALVLAACGSTADSGSGTTGAGGVKVDKGVTDSTITLGIMGDTSGVFKNLGAAINAGNQLWADDVNAAGGVCNRQIKLEIVDHGYKADTAKTLYPQLEPKGAGHRAAAGLAGARRSQAEPHRRQRDGGARVWSSLVLNNPNIMMIGTTYDLEIVNGLAYLQQQGLLKDGDTIGHIYIDGEYGGDGLLGSKYYASKHNLTIKEAKITSTDNDLTNIVTGFKGDGVKAIVLTTTPGQSASALAADQGLGLNVPVLGNNPTVDPALLKTPAAGALGNLYVAASAPLLVRPEGGRRSRRPRSKYPSSPVNGGVDVGYVEGLVWQSVLTKACEGKDLSRAGVQSALKSLTSVQTEGLVATLDYSSPGAPPTRGVYIAKVDQNAEGGLTEVAPLFTAPDAAGYKAPFQS
jgi:ABC-type branched-subunit amino acid transport system substrate-binding protein